MGSSEFDVLVVGAGPTGLILCHELLRRGVRCRLVDKRATPSSSTRAFTLHARTMEMFDHMGLADRVDELREMCPGNRFLFPELAGTVSEMPVLDFTRLTGTRYNYYGKVNQNDLDQALRDSLAAKYSLYPEYDVELLDCTLDGDRVSATLRHGGETGKVKKVSVPWLVGADGSRSTVRENLGLSFEQKEGDAMTMSMVDAKLEGFSGDRAWVNYYIASRGFMLVTGLPGDKFRMYLAGELENLLKDNQPREAFQKGLDFFHTGARIVEMDWSSTWLIRKIVGDAYMRGRIVLCGDATHVHSPAGGQGMNACMQDAFNLGWKLAYLIKGRARDEILQTYPQERRPIAEQVTAGADRMHQILFNAAIPVAERFKLTQNDQWHDEAIRRISALSHNYRSVEGTADAPPVGEVDVRVGDRAPDCVLCAEPPKRRLYDITRHPGFTLLLIADKSDESLRQSERLAQHVAQTYGHLVKAVIVSSTHEPRVDYDHQMRDPDGAILSAYGGGAGQMILIRPDLYVGFRGALDDGDALLDRLGRWLCAGVR